MIHLTDFILITYYYYFPYLNQFPAQKIINSTLDAPFGIPGASTDPENDFRVKPIIESEIDFLLDFDRYSRD